MASQIFTILLLKLKIFINNSIFFLHYLTFNFKQKKMRLALNGNIGILLEKKLSDFKSEQSFLKEFIENQRKYETELFGSYLKINITVTELTSEEFEKMRIQREV